MRCLEIDLAWSIDRFKPVAWMNMNMFCPSWLRAASKVKPLTIAPIGAGILRRGAAKSKSNSATSDSEVIDRGPVTVTKLLFYYRETAILRLKVTRQCP